MEKNRKKAILLAGCAGCMWGTIGLFVRLLGKYGISSQQLTEYRLLIATAVLGCVLAIRCRPLLRIQKKDWPLMAAAGLICLLLFNMSYGTTIEYSTMSFAAVLLYTSPAIVTLISAVLFHEKLTGRKCVSVALAVTGCAFVSGIMQGGLSYPSAAYLWGICAAVSYASYSIVAGQLLKKYHPVTVLFYAFLFAAAGGLFCVEWKGAAGIFAENPVVMIYLPAAALICNLLPYLCYNMALKKATPGTVAVAASVEPAAASVFGMLILGEQLNIFQILGIASILGAIVIQNTGEESLDEG